MQQNSVCDSPGHLVYRGQLFPLPAYARAFELLCQRDGERQGCKVTVELLALAHERTCETELAQVIDAGLHEGLLPDLTRLRARFSPSPAVAPAIMVDLAAPGIYDELIAGGSVNCHDASLIEGASSHHDIKAPTLLEVAP